MNATYSFMEATPLIGFIEERKKDIIGKPIVKYYSLTLYGCMSDEPVAFEFEDLTIVLFYFIYSNLTLRILDPHLLHANPDLNFLYKDVPESRNVRHYLEEREFPFVGCKVADITIERFSEEFEINGTTGETRPDGGDYFKAITVHMENGSRFYICGRAAMYDGYLDVWDDSTR